jgi:hypothetical protein
MKAAAKQTTSSPAAFPALTLRGSLNDFFNQTAKDRRNDPFKPKGTVHDLVPALDSLTVARSLNVVSKILKCKVPAKIVRRGGYANREQLFDDLLPKIEGIYKKRSKPVKS